MRKIIVHPTLEELRPRADTIAELTSYIIREVTDALSSRFELERLWRDNLRRYEAVPRQRIRNSSIENAPNIEVPVGAVACDVFYSIALSTIYGFDPPVKATSIEGNKRYVEHAKALQAWLAWTINNEFRAKQASEHSILDVIQQGTGVYYIPWIEEVKKTKSRKIISRRPEIRPWPLEDLLVPGGSMHDLQEMPWVGLRYYLTPHAMNLYAKRFKWDTGRAQPMASVGWVRQQRENLGRTTQTTKYGINYELYDLYMYYDIDGDGIDEDLLVTWDKTSQSIMKIRYNPYDRRPIETMHYQKRAFMFYSMGIMEKLGPIQDEITDIHNHRNLNMLLANTRLWKAKRGRIADNFKIWPGRMIPIEDKDDITSEQMGDVYPSSDRAEAITNSIAEKLVGINEMASPRPSQILGSRTPGITSQLMVQQFNQRFTGPFNSLRDGTAGAIKQCLYRYQERFLAGDTVAVQHVIDVLGQDQAKLVVEILASEDFDNEINIDLSATGPRTSKEAERQGLIQLGPVLIQYYEKAMQLTAIVANDKVPPTVREIAKKITRAANEYMERMTRSFENIKDPKAFIVDMEEDIDRLGIPGNQDELGVLGGLVGGMDVLDQGGGEGGNGSSPLNLF